MAKKNAVRRVVLTGNPFMKYSYGDIRSPLNLFEIATTALAVEAMGYEYHIVSGAGHNAWIELHGVAKRKLSAAQAAVKEAVARVKPADARKKARDLDVVFKEHYALKPDICAYCSANNGMSSEKRDGLECWSCGGA